MPVKRKQSLFIFIFLAVVLLLTGGAMVYFLLQSRDRVVTMQNALEAVARGDDAEAIELLKAALDKDAGNETATVKLAELLEKKGDWSQSSFYWLKAAKLNTLKAEYLQKSFDNLLKARNFRKLTVVLQGRYPQVEEMSDEVRLLHIYSLLMSNQQRKGIELWQKFTEAKPECVNLPLGHLIQVTHFSGNQSFEWAHQELTKLRHDPQNPISQEALIAIANLNRMRRQFADEEENLKTLVAENHFIGTPLLGEFYANHLLYPEAIDLIEPYLKEYPDGRLALILGEMLTLTNQPNRLSSLAADWKNLPGKDNLKISYYLDILQAFLRKDFEQMAKLHIPIAGQFQTPLAAFIALLCDMQTNETARMTRDLRRFAAYAPFFDLRERAHFLVVLYLQDRLKAGPPNEELAQLAEELLAAHLIDEENYTARIVATIAKLKNNTLTENDVDQILEDFAEDPTCLEVAATFHYMRKNYDLAWQYLETLKKLSGEENPPRSVRRLAIAVLNALGKTEETARSLLQLLDDNPTVDDCLTAFHFFFANRRVEDLRRLAQLDSEAPVTIRPAVTAAIQLLEGQQDAALDALQKLATNLDDLRFFAGMTLAENGRRPSAIEKLTVIHSDFPNYPQVCLALAQLYQQEKQWVQAMEKANEAVTAMPFDPEANLCLASCLRHANSWRPALEATKPFLWKNATPQVAAELRDIWIWAMENSLQDKFASKRYPMAQQLIQELQTEDPENAVALEFADKIEQELSSKKPKSATME